MTDYTRPLTWWEVVGALLGLMAAILVPGHVKFWFFAGVLVFAFMIRPGMSLLCWLLGFGSYRH